MRRGGTLLLVGLLGIAGCAGGGGPHPGTASPAGAAAATPPTPLPLPALPPAPAVSLAPPARDDGDYKLAAKDQLSLTVHGQKDLTRTLRVSQSGTITVPLLGEVHAAGLSAPELERRIEDGLRGGYLMSPRVSVAVSEFQGRQFTVMGAVQRPGAFPLKANHTTMMLALSEAKGVKDGADRVAYLLRAHPRPGEPQPVMVDLDALLRQGDPGHNVVVEPGDSVYVPEANTYYVAGEVEKKGAFVLRRGMTLSKALTEAGGVTKLAATGEIRVVRTGSTGEKQEIGAFDLQAVMGGDRRQDIPLQAQDVVVVPESGTKRAAYALRDVLKSIIRFSLIAL
jgi:polysaccharide biosynthesis/export protein